jgi:hypothetical protein
LITYWPISNLHSAPPPTFFMISFGSIVHSNLEMLSTIDPAAPSDEAPALSPVALTSFASRPVKVRLRSPKVRSQVHAVMSTLLVLQTTESAVTEIFVLGVKSKLVLPPKRRAIILLSKARTNGEYWAITAVNARAVGPVAVTGAATATCCPTIVKIAGRMNLIICAVSRLPAWKQLLRLALFDRGGRGLY